MLVLAIDSSATASVALGRIAPGSSTVELLSERFTADTRSHAEVMAPFVAETLDQAGVTASDVGAIVTGTGPGPFTGLRAGIVTARILAFAWDVPLFGLMSLYSLAEQAAEHARAGNNAEFLVATDARRREVYTARFALTQSGYELKDGPHVGPAAEAVQLPAYGAGAGLYSDQLQAVEEYAQSQPQAASLLAAAARIGVDHLSTDTSALYLRESDVKVPASAKKANPSC